VAIVNQSLARKYLNGEDAIGKRIYHDWAPEAPMEIVGIVDDIREGPIESPSIPVLYVPFEQKPVAWFAILIRTAQGGDSALAAIPTVIHGIDPEIAVSAASTMTKRIQDSPVAYLHRSSAWLVGGFAVMAFLLGVVGLYGVVAYSVGHRTREIGIRMALGAGPRSVYRLILGESARLVAAGSILGAGGSLAVATLLHRLFFGVRAWDLPTPGIVASVLIAAALLASYIPARRAASIHPIEALRSE